MSRLFYLSHPEVDIDPAAPVPDWGLNAVGRDRAQALAGSGWPGGAVRIVASPERKAQETAAILSRGAPFQTIAALAEIDRSSTGFVPPARHEALADALFARPDQSAEGWETARAAQTRVRWALNAAMAGHDAGDLVLVGHGGVGTLLWCALADRPIARSEDQPGQGHGWAATLPGLVPLHPWISFEALAGHAPAG